MHPSRLRLVVDVSYTRIVLDSLNLNSNDRHCHDDSIPFAARISKIHIKYPIITNLHGSM